ncbi:hypothetical protein HWV62_42229 [Athelia sp. TMB]|nr:hypothetical protein HWV62_42229 [Athelia sp. TMB]
MDSHSSHYTPELLTFAKANNIVILGYPPHCTHALQGLDVVCFAAMKQAWKDEIDRFEAEQKRQVGKEHFAGVFGRAFLAAFTVPTVLTAFEKTGIHPFDPNVITAQQMKPSLPSSIVGALPLPMPSPVKKILEVFDHTIYTQADLDPDNYQPPTIFTTDGHPSITTTPLFPSLQPTRPFTPAGKMRVLGAALASTASGAFLVQKAHITSDQTIPSPIFMQPTLIPDPDWSLLNHPIPGPSQPRTELEDQVKALTESLALAKLQVAAKDAAIMTGNVQLAIQGVYNKRLNEALNVKEKRKETDRTKMFPDGKPRLLTDDALIAELSQAKALKVSKEMDKIKRAEVRAAKKVGKEAAAAAWKLLMAAHDQAVAAWMEEKLALRARGVKVKDLPKGPKKPLKPKPVVELGSESEGAEDEEDMEEYEY